jgi:hypothetical protein
MALVFQFFLAGVLSTQLVGRAFGPRGTRYLSIQKGSDYLAGFVAVVAAISTLVAIAMTGLALGGCATRATPDSLAAFVYQTDTASGGNLTLWLNMTRRPFFYTDLSWFQICLDDKPMAIVFLCVAGALIVLDVMVAVIQFRARTETLAISLAMTTPSPTAAASTPTAFQHSAVALGRRAPREEEDEVMAFMMLPVFTLERKQS